MAKITGFPEVHYDHKKSVYWMKLSSGKYIPLGNRDVKLHALSNGFPYERDEGSIKLGEHELIQAQIHKNIEWAGALSGHQAGPLVLPDGSRILVTRQVNPVQPKAGDFPFLDKFLTELFGAEQLNYVIAWMKISWESLNSHRFQPGQMLAVGGPANCGKSLFHYLVTKLLGGRSGKPFRYMSGQTTFNGDLACAEHLYIEDEDASYDIRSRRKFGTAIKDFTVNEYISIHDKGYQAITLPFYRRLTCSFNDEAENVMILPPMDDSILDKVMLFKCSKAALPLDRKKISDTIDAELPGLVHSLRNFKILASMKEKDGNRFGVRAYHNAELLAALSDLSQETQLLAIIDETIFEAAKNGESLEFWRGSAQKLTQELLNSPAAFTASKIFTFSNAAGTYLARLRTKFPARISRTMNGGKPVWTIKNTQQIER